MYKKNVFLYVRAAFCNKMRDTGSKDAVAAIINIDSHEEASHQLLELFSQFVSSHTSYFKLVQFLPNQVNS